MATRPQTPTRPDPARTRDCRLPLRRPPTGSYATSDVIAIPIAASSLAGLAKVGTRYGSDPPSVLVSRGGDAANLVVVVPILLADSPLTPELRDALARTCCPGTAR